LAITGLLAAAAAVNCLNSIYQSNLNRKNQAKRDQQLEKTRKQHDLWVMEQQDKRQYRKLDPLVDYEIEPHTTYVAVADYLPEKAIGSHIRISIEEMLRERSQIGFPLKVLGGGGCLRGDIRGEGMVKQLFFELCEKAESTLEIDLLSTVNLVVCWGSVQPLMGKISPHISVFNMLDFTGELDTKYLDSIRAQDGGEQPGNTIDMQLSLRMREQLWQSVNFSVDTVSMLSCLQRAYHLKAPFNDDILSHLDEDSNVSMKKLLLGYVDGYMKADSNRKKGKAAKQYGAMLRSYFEGSVDYSAFLEQQERLVPESRRVASSGSELVKESYFLEDGKLKKEKALKLMTKRFGDDGSFKVGSRIQRKQLGGAKSKYAPEIHTDDVLMLYDVTLFDNGKKGWLLTDDGMYSSEQAELDGKKSLSKLRYKDIDLKSSPPFYKVKSSPPGIYFSSKGRWKEKFILSVYDDSRLTLLSEFFEELLGVAVKQRS